MKRIAARLLLASGCFVVTLTYVNAQNTTRISSVTGKLVRVTPPLSQIDKNSMYGLPLQITRGKKEELLGVVDIEKAEENVFKNQFPDNSANRQQSTQQDNSFLASISSTISQNYDGQTYPNFAPSDNNLAVGPNHVIQIINHSSGSAFRVWDKSGNVLSTTILSTVTGLSGSGDPVVLYDQLADRWVLTEFGKTGNVRYINTLIIAISKSPNPADGFFVYSYVVSNNGSSYFVDYPKYAVWRNAYYATSNDFNTAGTSYLGSSIYAFDRNAMIAGNATAAMVNMRFSGSGSRYYSMAPVCQEGPTISNQSGLFALLQDNSWVGAPADSIFLFEFTPNFTNPSSSVVGPFRAMATQPFNTNTGSLPQKGTSQTLQSLSQRLMHKVIYRNFGNSESIVCNTTDLANGRTGVHWWEFRRPESGNWNIYQEGLYQPSGDTHYRFMGSIAINANGDIGLLCNLTSSSIYPSARFTARNSCDPLGQMTLPETVVKDGTTYEASNNRYGDYNTLTVDPSNGSFWGTAQYNAPGYGTYGNWATRVVNFSITPCNATTAGTVSGATPLCIGQTATYTSNGTAGGTWSSTNTSIATVNSSTGLVTAVAAGTSNITYTISGLSSFKTLTVNANVSAGTVSGSSPLCIGATATYSSNGTTGGTWTSNNTSVATVNATTGVVTAVAAGSANITYTVSSGCGSPVSSFASITVNPNANAGTVSGTSPLTVGQTTNYSSSGDTGGTWSSTNTSVATVDASTGNVTAIANGTANITYTVNSGCNAPVSSFKTVTVGPVANAGTVSGTTPLCIGQTATYTTDGDPNGTWSSTNTSVATVDASTGNVTAIAAGTTDITYTINGVSSLKTLTVNENVSAGTVSGSSSLCVGGTTTFTSNGTTGGTWSSDNTSAATVDPNSGVVTGVATGSANITYTVNSGCGSPVSSSNGITINDCSAPTITCPGDVTASATIACSANVATSNPTTTNTTTLTWTMTGATSGSGSGDVGTQTFNIGTTTITYTATNAGSASVTCSFNVVVTDNTAATITCPLNISSTQNGVGKCSAVIATPNPNTSGNCSVQSLTWTLSGATNGSGSGNVGTQTFNVGITTVTYTVTNGAGNTASCSYTVTVRNKKCAGSPAEPLLTNAETNDGKLKVTVFPNPTETYFTLQLSSTSTDDVEISIYAINGKLIEKLSGSVFQTYRFGNAYSAGTYVVKVKQGSDQSIMKLVK